MIYCHVMLVNMLQMSGLDSGKGLKYRKDNLVIFSFNIHMTQGKIDLRNESGRPMKVKVAGEVSEK